jgi:hypothetical protein
MRMTLILTDGTPVVLDLADENLRGDAENVRAHWNQRTAAGPIGYTFPGLPSDTRFEDIADITTDGAWS